MTNSINTTEQLIFNVYKAVEIAIMKKAPITIEFTPDNLTVEVAERVSSYLDALTTVKYNFDARRSRLMIVPIFERTLFFIDDTITGRLH